MLRPAGLGDLAFTLNLRRQYEPTPFLQHCWWFLRRIRRPGFWIVEAPRTYLWPVGVFRIDGNVVSIQIKSMWWGHGFATCILAAAPGGLRAYIHRDNRASIRAFERAGWLGLWETDGGLRLYSKPECGILEGTGREAECPTSPSPGPTTPPPKL